LATFPDLERVATEDPGLEVLIFWQLVEPSVAILLPIMLGIRFEVVVDVVVVLSCVLL